MNDINSLLGIEIEKYDIISFDVFDTAVERVVYKPEDVFSLVENISKSNENFKTHRIKAERKSRLKKNKEITIYDIYDELNSIYPKDILNQMLYSEMEIEKTITYPRKIIKEFYEKCIELKKRIIFITDMYLPYDVIEDILITSGYEKFDKIYLSSQLGLTKSKGNIFDYIIADTNVSPKSILHIGDNKDSDYYRAIERGISAILVNKEEKIFQKNINLNLLYNFIEYKNKTSCLNEMEYLGYKAFGPIIFGFSKWLHNSTKELNIDKIYFLSRDGFIIKKAYDMLFEKSNTYYMFASRRAFSVPNVYPNMQYKEVCDVLNLSRSITIETFKKKLGIEKICYNENELNNTKFSIDSNELKEFFHKNRDLIFCNAEKERKALVNYLREISFCGNVAIVDIGWFGNMQKSLEKICIDNVMDAKINGFYVGKRHGYKDNMRNGFLFDNCKNKDISIAIDSMNALFESCFLADHGSVRSYISNIEFFPCEYNNEDLLLIKDFQQGALRFVKDFSIFLPYVNLSSKDSFKIFFKEFCFPRKEIAIKFGNLTFYDYNLVNIAQPRNMYVYFKNPALFFSDFRYCNWKIGFLTRVFNFRWLWYPCYYVYRRLRNCIQ